MQQIKHTGDLPTPIRVMADNFYEADLYEPELYRVSVEEYDSIATSEDVVTQLLYWRDHHKFFAVVAGDAERMVKSELIVHDPFRKKVSLLAFYEVDETDIRSWNKKYSKKSLRDGPVEFTDDIQGE